MIVSERTHAHDFRVAVRLDGQIGLHAENNVDSRGIRRVNGQLLDAAHLGASRVAHGSALFEPASEWEISVIGFRAAAKRSGDGKDHADQELPRQR